MNRRQFIASAGAVLLLPSHSFAAERVFYKPGLAEAAMQQGKVVVLDFWTNWCTTCAAQERTISELRRSDPVYDATISFITVDWDKYSTSQLSKDLAIPRRSTLVALKGTQEIGRIVAGTSRKQIKDLLDAAVASATS